MSFFEFAKASFLTEPDWRYRRAMQLYDSGVTRGCRREDDRTTLDILKLKRLLAGESRATWSIRLKALRAAHLLAIGGSHRSLRLEIECRLLEGGPLAMP